MAYITPDDVHWDDADIARLLRMKRERVEKIIALMDADELSVWQDALSGARAPGPGEILGVHWSHADMMLELGDIEQLRRWIKPFITELAPKPKLKRSAA